MSAVDQEEYGGTKAKDRKRDYRFRLIDALNSYKNIMVIGVDNVGSNQMQKARIMLRGRAIVLMGKNTIIRKVLRDEGETNPQLLELLPHIVGNIGFVFTNEDLPAIREDVEREKIAAAAKSGQFAPDHVIVPKGMTPLDPGQTNFFQAMNIATKITKGAIEIINDVQLITKGERVTSSAVGLLNKMAIKPFFYSIVAKVVSENGSVYEAAVLDLTQSELTSKFVAGVTKLAAISLAIGYCNAASIPHSFSNALKMLVAISLETKITFNESKQYKDFLENPELLKAAQAAAAAASGGGGGAAAVAAAPEPEPEEEEEESPMMDMFGGGSDY
jgi:large subunit ribosomal protein LP0